MTVRYINGYIDAPASAKFILVDKGDYVSLQQFEGKDFYQEVATFDGINYGDKELFKSMISECSEIVGNTILWVEKPMWMFNG